MSQKEVILKALQDARANGVSNVQFNNDMHIFRYGARIAELREQGHIIRSVHVKKGLWKFYLEDDVLQAYEEAIKPEELDYHAINHVQQLFDTGNLQR